jgi:Fe-S-cluster containining protein
MPRRPRRKKKNARAQRIEQSKQGAPATQGTNARRFTTKGWAVTAELLGKRRDRTAVFDLLGFFHWLGDRNVDIIKRGLPPLPCEAGCCYCCVIPVDMLAPLPPEVFRMATFLCSERAASLVEVKARLEEVDAATRGMTDEERATTRLRCPFLNRDRCMIYPVRPMRCRAHYSLEAEGCRRNYLGEQKTIPVLNGPALLYKSLQTGMRLGLQTVGLQSMPLVLTRAMMIAVEEPDTFERWLTGEPVFENVGLADEAEEARFLIQFARQAKRQVRDERRRMRKVTTMFLEEPGAWASYSLYGVEPRWAAMPAQG